VAFLQGLFSGDGSITRLQGGHNFIYEYATVSKPLADGVLLLLQSLGIVASLRERWMNKSTRPAYIIRVSGIEQLERLKGVFGEKKRLDIEELIRGYEKRIEQSGFQQREGFALLSVTRITVEEGDEYVYSMETETARSLAPRDY